VAPLATTKSRIFKHLLIEQSQRFRREAGNGWLAGIQCNLALTNVFARPPPFVNRFHRPSGAFGYDPVNASLVGRQLSIQIAKQLGR
jgi:hypothetical protein